MSLDKPSEVTGTAEKCYHSFPYMPETHRHLQTICRKVKSMLSERSEKCLLGVKTYSGLEKLFFVRGESIHL